MRIHHPKWNTLVLTLICVAACPALGDTLCAAELKRETLSAWAAYVRATEDRIGRELSSGGRFLVLDFQAPDAAAAEKNELRNGRIPVARMDSLDDKGSPIEVPDGMIHHWRGSVLIPGVDLDYVLTRVENPVSQEIRQEDVLQSAVLERGDGYLKLYLKLQRSKIVTVVYNTIHEVRYERRPNDQAWSSSKAVKIAELSHPNSPEENEKPAGKDHGFLWRLNSYWRYRQVDEGVIVECESLSLSRSIPRLLEYFVRPIIDRIARESMERTLASMRDRIVRSHKAPV
jgi:hypothetical protein